MNKGASMKGARQSKNACTENHDLFDFLVATSNDITSEYERIRRRVSEDPGTAGDQGENNWRELLEKWLPPHYRVVTKGRILGHEGGATPQIDVLVLQPGYPQRLWDKKLFLAGGVAAAFECKLTLRSEHIREAVENAVKIRNHLRQRRGSVYREVCSPMIYGLLAHSHDWKEPASTPIENIETVLYAADTNSVNHPREMLDVLCVADLATWTARKTFSYHRVSKHSFSSASGTSYSLHVNNDARRERMFSPIGVMVSYIFRKLAYEDSSLRELASYFQMAGVEGCAKSDRCRSWPLDTVSEHTRETAAASHNTKEDFFGESLGFF